MGRTLLSIIPLSCLYEADHVQYRQTSGIHVMLPESSAQALNRFHAFHNIKIAKLSFPR